MLKPSVLALAVGLIGLAAFMLPVSASAADLPISVRPNRSATLWCGECGCLHKSYVYHRELRSTYGISFDPRNYDQTEPHYYLGRMRAYPRYWVPLPVRFIDSGRPLAKPQAVKRPRRCVAWVCLCMPTVHSDGLTASP